MTDSFSAAIAPRHLLHHPFYQAWMKGEVSRATLRDYAKQYYSHVAAFPRYLSAIHSACPDEQQRRVLLENLNDEEGLTFGVSHPELWLRFAEGLGATRTDTAAAAPRAAVARVVATFFRLCRSSYAEGLGALYAYESQVPEVAESKLTGLKEMYGIRDERTLEFFEVHRHADKEHRAAILNILESLSELEKAAAQRAAREAADALWDFLTEVYGDGKASA
jgi:pyrroloquinoline-quinone synthase